eukprot:1606761-Pleurochrysis_carterae.AAC.3
MRRAWLATCGSRSARSLVTECHALPRTAPRRRAFSQSPKYEPPCTPPSKACRSFAGSCGVQAYYTDQEKKGLSSQGRGKQRQSDG